ncbi:MAG: UbiA family prenyltransferase [Pirellulaceae bacterium]|nr:UbiA family prenyltransferase [Pirellulaceae bacterium]
MLAYLRLMRIPNVFTAMAEVLAAALFAAAFLGEEAALFPHWASLMLLMVASGMLYSAGMVLNDYFDFEQDLKSRPNRPLPLEEISLQQALIFGGGLLIGGVVLSAVVGFAFCDGLASWRLAVVAALLALLILLYDKTFKKTLWAPLFMGLCRMANVLLGVSLVADWQGPLAGFSPAEVVIASGMGIYVVGLTYLARQETEENTPSRLVVSSVVMLVGIAMWGVVPYLGIEYPLTVWEKGGNVGGKQMWPILLLFISLPVLRRLLVAWTAPNPGNIQLAVKQAIFSLLFYYASLALAFSGPIPAVCILSFFIPMLLLGRYVYST